VLLFGVRRGGDFERQGARRTCSGNCLPPG
jgi:hypothetical protein